MPLFFRFDLRLAPLVLPQDERKPEVRSSDQRRHKRKRHDGCHGTPLRTVLRQMDALSRAAARGAKIASGSASGAVGVAHGAGTLEEYRLLEKAGVSEEKISWANELLRARFRRQN